MSASEYYSHTSYPATGAQGSSAAMRAELESLETGFGKLPDLSGNGGKITAINSGGTGIEAIVTTGTGSGVRATSPTLVTPNIGVATATTVNKVTITAPATGATLTLADGSSLIKAGAHSLTLTTSGTTSVTLPTSGTLATQAEVQASDPDVASAASTPYADADRFTLKQSGNFKRGVMSDLASYSAVTATAFVMTGTGATARSLRGKLREIATPYDFGAVGNGVADDYTPLQYWADECIASDLIADVPQGIFLISNKVVFNASTDHITLRGRGRRSVIKVNATNKTAIEINSDGNFHTVNDLHLSGPMSPGNTSSIGLLFTGAATQRGHQNISRVLINGFYASIRDEKLATTTGAGESGGLNWMSWTDLQLINAQMYNFWGAVAGSGTGNTWVGGRYMTVDADSVHLQFDGTGAVVGDIIVNGIHAGCTDTVTGSSLIGVGADTVYRAQTSIIACQLDANCNRYAKQSSTGSIEFKNWYIAPGNIGGTFDGYASLQPMSQTIVSGRHVSDWKEGVLISTNSTGAQSTDCFKIGFGTDGQTHVTLTTTMDVGGVGPVISRYEFAVVNNGGTTSAQLLRRSQSDSTQLTWTFTNLGSSEGKFTLAYTPSAVGTSGTARADGCGGRFKLGRMVIN